MTKSFVHTALVAAALAASGLAFAAPEIVEIAGTPLRGVSIGEGQQIVGHYAMSDGRSLQLVQRGKYIRAELTGEPTLLMLASGSGVLRSIDGRAWMRFGEDGAADDVTVVLSRPDGQQQLLGMAKSAR